jgi:autotransporter-associated beta strand protein
MKHYVFLAAAFASASLAQRALGAGRTWTGAGDGVSWNDPLNWDGGTTVPLDGDDITFPNVVSGSAVDVGAPRTLGALLFSASGTSSLNNSALTLGGTFTQNGAGAVAINSDVATGDVAQTFGGTGVGGVTFTGLVSGAGLLTFNTGTWTLTNDQNTFSGGVQINSGARLEAKGNVNTPNVVFSAVAGTPTHLGVGDGGPVTINGGTLKLTTIVDASNVTGNLTIGRTVTFGSNGGTLDLTNTVGGTLGGGVVIVNGRSVGGGGGNLPVVLTGPGVAVIKWNGGERGISVNDPANGDLQVGNNALRTASFSGDGPTTPVRFEITNGALMELGTAFNTLAAPLTLRGQPGGSSSGSGISQSVGRAQMTAGVTSAAGLVNAYTFTGGLTFEDAFQVSLANATRGIDGNITIAGTAGGHPGDVGLSGRGTGTAVATNHTNALIIGTFGAAGTSRTVLVQSGGLLNLDNRIRTDQTFMHGVQVNAQTVLQPDATLRFRTSFVRTNETNNVSFVEVLGNVTAAGTTGHDALIDVTLPVRGDGDAPTNFGGYSMGDAPGGANLIVNGSGFGGLTILGRPHVGKSYNVNNPTNEASLPTFVDGFTNVQRLLGQTGNQTNRAVAAPARLAGLLGSGGYLSIGAQGETFPFPSGGEWGLAVPVGLRVTNSNTNGADVSLPPGTWHHNLHVESGAELLAAAIKLTNSSIISGGGMFTSGTGLNGFTLDSGSSVAPGAGGPGILTSNGDINFLPSSTYSVDLKGPVAGTGYDQLSVIGGVTLTNIGGAPNLSATLGYDPAPTDKLAILLNDGSDPIVGRFANLPEGATMQLTNAGTGHTFTFKISYVANADGGPIGNDIVLSPVPEPTAFAAFALAGIALLGRRSRSHRSRAATSPDAPRESPG